MYAVHFGVDVTIVDDIRRDFRHLAFIDGDGWNCWGEAPGTDVNDTDTRHVVLHHLPGEEIALIAAKVLLSVDEEKHFLVPMGGYPQQVGIRVVITDHDDWGENVTSFR